MKIHFFNNWNIVESIKTMDHKIFSFDFLTYFLFVFFLNWNNAEEEKL